MKRFAVIFLICSAVFTLSPTKGGISIGDNAYPKVQITRPDTPISSEQISEQNKYIKVTIKYPVIKGLSDASLQKQLNDRFKNDALNFRKEIEKQAVEGYNYALKQNFPFKKYEVFIDYKVTFNKNNMISIPASYYSYTGGAHGFTFIKPYNINLATGKEMTLKDIFKEGTDYKFIIKNEVTRQIKENMDEYFPEALEKVKTISDNQTFYLEYGNIVIYYGLYDIAPYASGIKEFRVPFSMFNTGVRPEFR